MVRSAPLVLLALLGLCGLSWLTSAPASPATQKSAGHCTDRVTWLSADGKTVGCYPYRCAAHGCFTSCRTDHDCAYPGSEHRSDGWPLGCQSRECVPYRNGEHGPEE